LTLPPRHADAKQLTLATAYRDRFREAFRNALGHAATSGEIASDHVEARTNLLAAITIGLFVSARINPEDAANICDSVATEVAAWSLAPRTA
jgi:hypothetical protein